VISRATTHTIYLATLVDNDEDTDDTIEPLVNQLGSAFDDASSSLSGLQRRGLVSRQDNDDVAQTMADIVSVSLSHAFTRDVFLTTLLYLGHRDEHEQG
jgi:hypothetical protein